MSHEILKRVPYFIGGIAFGMALWGCLNPVAPAGLLMLAAVAGVLVIIEIKTESRTKKED